MIVSLCLSLPVIGQNLAAFSGTKTPVTATIPNITAAPLSRGPGLTVASGTTFNSGNWATGAKVDPNDYIQWSITAAAGYFININELQINFDRDPDGMSHFFTGNGPAKIRIRTSLDNYRSDLYSNDKVSNSGQSPIIETNLNSELGGSITFRLYGYASNIGMLGPLGTFDIEGGLGKVLGLDNTGIRIAGTLTYDGLHYSDGVWTPNPPNAHTRDKNILILNGTYTESRHVQVKNLIVSPGAKIVIKKTGALTVNGDLTTSNNVILQSDANKYSSLIVQGEVIGTAKYQRQAQTTTRMGVASNELLISAPVTGESFKVFRTENKNIVSNSINSLFLFGPFNKIKGTYTLYSNTEKEVLTVATGYKAAATTTGSFTFTGAVNTSDIKKNILNSGPANAEWNLIGNPYPSYISLSEFLAVNTSQWSSTAAGIYSYDPEVSNGWMVQNLAYLTLHPNAKINPGQGFMVASKIGGATVTFTPAMRSVGDRDEFAVRKDSIAKNVGFLKLKLANGILNYNTDFYFNDQSTKGLDPGYDARVYGDQLPDFAIYSHLAEKNTGLPMAVQSLAYTDLLDDTIIPLGINASEGQHITISMADVMLPKEINVYLEDKLANTYTLLNTNDYTFFTNSKVSKTGRFFLHVSNATLSFGSKAFAGPRLFTSNASKVLQIEGKIAPNTLVYIYDLNGRLVLITQLNETTNSNQINLSLLESGLYIVKLKAGTLEKIKKIMLN